MSVPPDRPRAVRCPACGLRTRHYPFVKPACPGYGLLCSRCGRVTQPIDTVGRAEPYVHDGSDRHRIR